MRVKPLSLLSIVRINRVYFCNFSTPSLYASKRYLARGMCITVAAYELTRRRQSNIVNRDENRGEKDTDRDA